MDMPTNRVVPSATGNGRKRANNGKIEDLLMAAAEPCSSTNQQQKVAPAKRIRAFTDPFGKDAPFENGGFAKHLAKFTKFLMGS